METVRAMQQVENGRIQLALAEPFWNQAVEINVLKATAQDNPSPVVSRRTLRGTLKRYAKPELIPLESQAWGAWAPRPATPSWSALPMC